MKLKVLFTAVIAIGSLNSINAQTLKEKMQAKVDALDKKLVDKANAGAYSPTLINEMPQDESAKLWEEGSYAYYQEKDGRWTETNKTNVTFLKNDEGVITSVKLGGGEYKLKGLEDGFGKYYFYDSYSLGLVMDSNVMVIFKPYNFSVFATVNKKLSNADEFTDQAIKEYVTNAETLISGNKSALAEEKAVANKAKYGLEGKDVSSVKIVNLTAGKNGKIGCYSNVSYDIEAKLKDGTVISTKNGGYKSDYEITFGNAQLESGKIKPAIYQKDVFSVDVKVKSNPSKTAHEEIVIPYNQAISFNWSGTGWSRSKGESARNIQIEMTQVKHSQTGDPLLKVRIKATDGSVLSTFKISPDMNIIVKLIGGYGGNDDGTVFPGGNGGSIKVIKDPSVEYYSLDASLDGGRGGKNEYGKTASSGNNGKITEEIRAVKF